MLDTRFPRPPGDIGNSATFPFPVDYRVVPAACVARVVRRDGPADDLVDAFLPAARALADNGAGLVTTSCGFLSPLQDRLAAALAVPVVASSLSLLPDLRRRHGADATIGVLTFDSTRLGPLHIPPGSGSVIVEGIDSGTELHRVIIGDLDTLDIAAARADAVSAATRLRTRADRLTALVLECTNLAPYREAITEAAGCRVFDIRDAIAGRLSAPTRL
jgi:Asp/Glu/hydantoin racemase